MNRWQNFSAEVQTQKAGNSDRRQPDHRRLFPRGWFQQAILRRRRLMPPPSVTRSF